MSRSHIGKNHLRPDTKANSACLLVASISEQDSRQPTYLTKDRLMDSAWWVLLATISHSSVHLQDLQVFRRNCWIATSHLSSLCLTFRCCLRCSLKDVCILL